MATATEGSTKSETVFVYTRPGKGLLGSTHSLRLLKATSIGSTAANRIKEKGLIGRVHSVFSGAIDVVMPGGHMISVVREDVGEGPINIVTELPAEMSMTKLGVESNQDVLRRSDGILFGGDRLLVRLQNATLYTPKRDFRISLRSIPEIRANLAMAAKTATRGGNHEGLGNLIEPLTSVGQTKPSHQLNSFSRLALPKARSLLRTIRDGRTSGLGRVVKDFVGLGPGLTPSADDLISGLMATLEVVAYNFGDDAEKVREINREMAINARGQTTKLSQEYLSHAAKGETNEHFLELIKKILTGQAGEVRKATERALTIGETSGTDTVLGILLGFQLSLDTKSAVGVL